MDDPVRSQIDLGDDRKHCGSDKESASSGLGLRASSLRQTAYIKKSTEYVSSKHRLFWFLQRCRLHPPQLRRKNHAEQKAKPYLPSCQVDRLGVGELSRGFFRMR
jgi:hypothetical protein